VIDPAGGLDVEADVAIRAGRIAAVAAHIPPEAAGAVLEVAGKLVTPGLIDMHVHVYPGVTPELGVEADRDCLAKGVTTVVDAGSAGAYTIEGFRRFIVEPSRTRILSLLNISTVGMPTMGGGLPETGWIELLNAPAAVAAAREHTGLVVGFKVRMSNYIVRQCGMEPLYRALDAAGQAGLPLMVHIGDMPAPLGDVLDLLRPGDIVTHMYTAFAGMDSPDGGKTIAKMHRIPMGSGQTLLDAGGGIIPQALAARERGVLFDVGHGQGSFAFAVAGPAIAQGFVPDTIGSDLHLGSIGGPVHDLPTVASRFLGLGLSLEQVIEATTARPARILGMDGEIGALQAGAVADVAVFDLLSGGFDFRDSTGEIMRGEQKLQPVVTVRAGEIVTM
jgi:dihydroorotase